MKDKWFEPSEDVFAIKKYGHVTDNLVYFLKYLEFYKTEIIYLKF